MIFSMCFIIVMTLLVRPAEEKIDPKLWKKALKIHDKAIVIDTHCDTPMAMLSNDLDIGQRNEGKSEVDLLRMKEGGLDSMFFAVYVSNNQDDKNPARDALETIDEIYRQVGKYPQLAEMAFSPNDIRRIHQTGKRAILIGMENGSPIEDSLRILRDFYRLGARYITLTHNNNNSICDSSTAKEPRWNGLSPFGKEVVQEMNRIGMMIDVSHISDKAFQDVIRESKAPVFASHSCVRSLNDVPRNMSDDMIKALAQKGGIIQLNFYVAFLDREYNKKQMEIEKILEPGIKRLRELYKDDRKSFWAEYQKLWKQYPIPMPPIDILLDHIDYVVKLVGIDYVGLGSDYDGAGGYPLGLHDASGYPLITYHLLKRGYSEKDTRKILGGNFLRFFQQVIDVSRQLSISKKP